MQSTVSLEEPLSLSIIGIVLLFILVVAVLLYFIIKELCKPKVVKETYQQPTKDLYKIKKKYLYQIDTLSNELNTNKIRSRTAYNRLSLLIRNFILEVTDIDLLKSTLSEIKKKEMGILYELIKEYYEPEFSLNNKGDITSSINKTKRVIEEWR